MPVQTSVNIPGFAYPGLLTDSGFNDYVESFVNAYSTPIDFGLGVFRGSADRSAVLPTSNSQEFLGVTVRDGQRENTFNGTISGAYPYQIGEMMGVLRKTGEIWVQVENAVTAGGAVYCRFASGAGGTQLGSFRADADTATAVLIPNAQWNTSALATGFAELLMPK